ncbi:hypothetical protein NIIDMKKI_36220 [Mycobacterium kansasii]|uniref:Heavy-metal-binding family protein n=2 Tax=Mycobacterium TaxID=1763 RepID=A0A7G1IBH7_MYCKA|nr:hypothetical protein NIIDMKKI_36220 [Mycobacterium kansasii]
MQPGSLDPVASDRLSHAEKSFTSDLSINEFALLHGAGFEPIELVMGVSVYHVGFQFSGMRQQQELGVLTEATYRARWNAMARMQAEADALKADGIVGVRLNWRHHGEGGEHLEFMAVGTAVRYTAKPGAFRRPNGQAFSSHLSGQDMVTLLRSGFSPVAFVMGNCVFHIAVQGFMQTLKQIGRNMEMPQWTQGNYQARELAMSRMQSEAERDGATGVVGCISRSPTMRGACTRSSTTRPGRPYAAPAAGKPSRRRSCCPWITDDPFRRGAGEPNHRRRARRPRRSRVGGQRFRQPSGVIHTAARRGLFRSNPERIQIGDWRYEVAHDGRLLAAHMVNGIVIAEDILAADAVGPHVSRALGQIVSRYGPTVIPNINAAVEILGTSTGYRY